MSKRRKTLSILFIPDGEQQTFTLKLRYGLVKTLFAFLVIFCCVLIFGTVSYWKLAKTALDYRRIELQNQKLLSDNTVINQIAESYRRTKDIENRIRNILGDKIDFADESQGRSYELTDNDGSIYANPLYAQKMGRFPPAQRRTDILSSYPTIIPVDGPISRPFLQHNATTGTGHFGIDIVAQEFSVISCAGDGVVVFADRTIDGGNEIIVDHQNGYISVYKHNAAILVQQRQFVRQGEAIALLGNSGESTAPHLHFEVWNDFKPVDPFTILPEKYMEPLNVRN